MESEKNRENRVVWSVIHAVGGGGVELFICLHVVAVIFDSCFAYAQACPVLSIQAVDSFVAVVLIDLFHINTIL